MNNMNKFRTLYHGVSIALIVVMLAGCSQLEDISTEVLEMSDGVSAESEVAVSDLTDTWSEETHSDDTEPNYDVVFNQDEVLELYITIDADEWDAMNEDLDENVNNVGNAAVGGGKGRDRTAVATTPVTEGSEIPEGTEPPERPEMTEGEEPPVRPEMTEGEEVPVQPEMTEGEEPPVQEEMPVRPVDTDGTESTEVREDKVNTETSDYEPIWVTSTITFEDDVWENVGIRFKGNSSLKSVASSDVNKFSFKLDFDEFEDDYPEIENQRFYGFKQLNLNNNFGDSSLLHEKVAADLFRDFGLVSANTSFCAVYVDYGEGSQYFGLYTIVEEVDDTVIEDQLGDDDGNLYKPDGDAASFAEGSFDESEMVKKNNEDEGDYSDVEALYTIINSDIRTTDVESWKESLEEVFNVDGFLKWLAVNTTIQNWDTYGTMTHNYYLYNDPATGLLNWIPWDNNEAFTAGKRGDLSLGLTEVQDNWPLISYIIDIPEYRTVYDDYLAQFVEEVFNEETMTATYDELSALIQSYAYAEEEGYTFLKSDDAFDKAIEGLYTHVAERNAAVEAYLEE